MKMNPLKAIAGIFMVATGSAHAIKQPKFTVLQKTEVFEVRKHQPYVVAEVVVSGPAT
jgi:hypothetical protein